MKEKDDIHYEGADRRSEPRTIVEQYSSVEFSIKNLNYIYQFKIWDTSSSGMSILVKEDSEVLKHLGVGDTLDMQYYPDKLSVEPIKLKTEIRHITKEVPDRIKGNYLVGLFILERQQDDP